MKPRLREVKNLGQVTQLGLQSYAVWLPGPHPTQLLLTMLSLVAQMVKNLPAMWETWVRSLGWEDPLEKEVATHSRILVWRIPWTEEPSSLSPCDRIESDMTEQLTLLSLSCSPASQ